MISGCRTIAICIAVPPWAKIYPKNFFNFELRGFVTRAVIDEHQVDLSSVHMNQQEVDMISRLST